MTFSRRLSDLEKYLDVDEFDEPAPIVGSSSTIIFYDPAQGLPEVPYVGPNDTLVLFEAPSNGRENPEAS